MSYSVPEPPRDFQQPPIPAGLPDPNTIRPDASPMQQGQVTPAPEHEPVFPAGDPVITPEPTEKGVYPVDSQGFTDLTTRRPRPQFRVGDELYSGKVEVAAGVMMKYSARAAQLQKTMKEDDPGYAEAEMVETTKMFRLLLRKESADRLIQHLHMVPPGATEEDEMRINDEADADPDAVGIETFMNLLPWLMEQYGMAPTEPSSNASDGSSTNPDDGNSSTPTSPGTESTSSPSL